MIDYDAFPDFWAADGAMPVADLVDGRVAGSEPFNDFNAFAASPTPAPVGLGRMQSTIDGRHAASMVVRFLVED